MAMYDDDDIYFINYLMEYLPHYIFWKDKNLVFKWCNKLFAQQFGYEDHSMVIGKTDSDFPWPSNLREKYINDDKQILLSGVAKLNYEEEQHQLDGSIKTLLVSKVPIYNSDNESIGILGIYTDITDHKKAEEYRIKHEAAEKVVKFTNLVAGSIAHELRTPLAGINSYMDLLEMSLTSTKQTQQEKDEFLKQAVNKIKSTIKATTHVINDLLLKVRTFATGQVPQKSFEEMSITTDVENLLDSFPFENNEQDLVKVSYNTRFKYLGDKVLTNHVLENLLKNALHAIKEADKGEIVIELKKDGDFNQLVFRDTALGIPENFVSKIFDQFETKKTTHGGSGLGLAFCKMVMDYYGGSITCQSKEGEYTEFTLSFPKIQTIQMEH